MSVQPRCPCCGQWLWQLSGLEARLYQTLSNGKSFSCRQLIDLLYGDREDGGPLYPYIVIHLTKQRLNRKIKKMGLQIICTAKGPKSLYRLDNFD